MLVRESSIFGADRRRTVDAVGIGAQYLRERQQGFGLVLKRHRRDPLVDHQPVTFARTRSIEADAPIGAHQRGDHVRAQRDLGVQQRIKSATGELRPQPQQFSDSAALVVDDERHPRQVSYQPILALADDPAYEHIGPLTLYRAHHRDTVADIAQRGQAQQAD